MPLALSIVPFAVLLLLQMPPEVTFARITLEPVHTVSGPVMLAGKGFTVIGIVVVAVPQTLITV